MISRLTELNRMQYIAESYISMMKAEASDLALVRSLADERKDIVCRYPEYEWLDAMLTRGANLRKIEDRIKKNFSKSLDGAALATKLDSIGCLVAERIELFALIELMDQRFLARFSG